MIKAKVIADSISPAKKRITTMVVTMPRIILAEFNTHRIFSRNSASSRAIPFDKMVKSIQENPFIPIAWQKDHKGMQGTEYVTNQSAIDIRKQQWLIARDNCVEQAQLLSNDIEIFTNLQPYCVSKTEATIEDGEGVTKQICNRLLEPFMWHTVIVTSTEWENFFELRCPRYLRETRGTDHYFRSKKDYILHVMNVEKANRDCVEGYEKETDLFWLKQNKGQAEIHMMALAESMYDALNESTPKELKVDEWHIPFGEEIDDLSLLAVVDNFNELEDLQKEKLTLAKIKVSTAMNARISYTVVGDESKKSNYENDIKLHNRLIESGHWSPLEHIAQCASSSLEKSGNFNGWIQYRQIVQSKNNFS